MRTKIFIAVAAVVALLAGGIILFMVRNGKENGGGTPGPANSATSTAPAATSTANIPPQVSVPDLNKPVVITASLSEENQTFARSEIANLVAVLKKDSDAYNEWMSLALYRKMIGDYDGAREIWEYTAVIRPNEAVSFHNLGNLYATELRDNVKAESYFLKAIDRGTALGYVYYAAYEFYRYYKKDLPAAKKILDRGIAALDSETANEFRKIRDSF